tara:strand:+ start:1312 stop:1461 length:150 start_codon:yes stop_codon:yes gene_type:complete
MNAKLMAFATTALAVVAGIYVYNEFIKADEVLPTVVGDEPAFSGRKRRR